MAFSPIDNREKFFQIPEGYSDFFDLAQPRTTITRSIPQTNFISDFSSKVLPLRAVEYPTREQSKLLGVVDRLENLVSTKLKLLPHFFEKLPTTFDEVEDYNTLHVRLFSLEVIQILATTPFNDCLYKKTLRLFFESLLDKNPLIVDRSCAGINSLLNPKNYRGCASLVLKELSIPAQQFPSKEMINPFTNVSGDFNALDSSSDAEEIKIIPLITPSTDITTINQRTLIWKTIIEAASIREKNSTQYSTLLDHLIELKDAPLSEYFKELILKNSKKACVFKKIDSIFKRNLVNRSIAGRLGLDTESIRIILVNCVSPDPTLSLTCRGILYKLSVKNSSSVFEAFKNLLFSSQIPDQEAARRFFQKYRAGIGIIGAYNCVKAVCCSENQSTSLLGFRLLQTILLKDYKITDMTLISKILEETTNSSIPHVKAYSTRLCQYVNEKKAEDRRTSL